MQSDGRPPVIFRSEPDDPTAVGETRSERYQRESTAPDSSSNGAVARNMHPVVPDGPLLYYSPAKLREILDELVARPDSASEFKQQGAPDYGRNFEVPAHINYAAVARWLWNFPSGSTLIDLTDHNAIPQPPPGSIVRARGVLAMPANLGLSSLSLHVTTGPTLRVHFSRERALPVDGSELSTTHIYVIGRLARVASRSIQAAAIHLGS